MTRRAHDHSTCRRPAAIRGTHRRRIWVAIVLILAAGGPARAQNGAVSLVSASSIYNHEYLPEYALDGDRETRWASRSAPGTTGWIMVDFGQMVAPRTMRIHWERARAIAYTIQMSADGRTWHDIRTVTEPDGYTDTLDGLEGSGRFLRIMCQQHTQFSLYSIWEIEFPDPETAAHLRQRVAAVQAAREAARQAQRQKAMATLRELAIDTVVIAVREDGVDGHWYANFGYYAPDENRMCYRAGGRLCLLDLESGELTTLVDDPDGSVRDPAVHYNGRQILFSWRPGGSRTFHLYEINADGSGLRQLTDGPYDDIEPTYLPDDSIMFVSSRCRRWVNCWLTQVGVLYRCHADGSSIRQISANIEHDNTPWVLPDGRVLYQRWEYVDRSQVHYHHLWTANPDGTQQMVFFGNMHPGGVFIDAKPIPGDDTILLIHSPGHGQREHQGHVAILDPDYGPDHRPALRNITKADYRDPYPLAPDLFLAARGNQLVALTRDGQDMLLFSLPRAFGQANLHEPRPLIPRPRERIISPRSDPREASGTFVLTDIYAGRNMEGVQRGEIASLLVLENLPKPINFTGGMEPMSYGGTFSLARVVGRVPVAPDGSAHFRLPATRAFYFVALDAQERSVKRMQSFTSVMPGEIMSCVGCHEPRTETPVNMRRRGNTLDALAHPAVTPEPVTGIPEVFDYARDVQPVLDRHCVRCHNPQSRKGGVLLTGDRGPMFSHSYFMLTARRQVADGRNRAQSNYPPRAIGDSASPLMTKMDGSHHNVRVPEHDVRTVRYWVHTGGAWLGTYAGLGTGMIGGYAQNRIDRSDTQWPSMQAAADVLEQRCQSCHQGAMALPASPSDNQGMMPWTIRYDSPKLRFSRHIIYNLTTPEASALLLAPLARGAGGWGMQPRAAAGNPEGEVIDVFADAADPGYRILLTAIRDTKRHLDSIKRFDMPGFVPREEYLREMKRYGILPPDWQPNGPVDPYALDRAYWDALSHSPATAAHE